MLAVRPLRPMGPPGIDVLIPTYDRSDLLGRALSSVVVSLRLAQVPFYIHVFDNLFHNVGFTAAMNKMARRGKHTWILALNDDCFVELGCIHAMLETAAIADIVGAVLLDREGKVIQTSTAFLKDRTPGLFVEQDLVRDKLVMGVSFACALIRRSVWNYLGGLDSKLFNDYSDVDFCLRALLENTKIAVAVGAKAEHVGGASKDRTKHINHDLSAYLEKWGKREDFPVPPDHFTFTDIR